MTISSTVEVKRGRRWLPRFSLRTLLLALIAIGLILGAVAAWFHAQEAEYLRQTKIAIRLADLGEVQWEQQTPSWLPWASDGKVFQRIVGIDCHGSAECDQVLKRIEEVPTLRKVSFFYNEQQLSERNIERLASLKQVRDLMIKTRIAYFGWIQDGRVNKEVEARIENRLRAADAFVSKLKKRLPNINVQQRVHEIL